MLAKRTLPKCAAPKELVEPPTPEHASEITPARKANALFGPKTDLSKQQLAVELVWSFWRRGPSPSTSGVSSRRIQRTTELQIGASICRAFIWSSKFCHRADEALRRPNFSSSCCAYSPASLSQSVVRRFCSLSCDRTWKFLTPRTLPRCTQRFPHTHTHCRMRSTSGRFRPFLSGQAATNMWPVPQNLTRVRPNLRRLRPTSGSVRLAATKFGPGSWPGSVPGPGRLIGPLPGDPPVDPRRALKKS